MKTRVPLWVMLASCAACLALGSVWAQAPQQEKPEKLPLEGILRSYPYLPEAYAGDYSPSVADWQALRMTALGASPVRVTEHFMLDAERAPVGK